MLLRAARVTGEPEDSDVRCEVRQARRETGAKEVFSWVSLLSPTIGYDDWVRLGNKAKRVAPVSAFNYNS